MPDLAEQIRRLIDESAPPIALGEIGKARSAMEPNNVIAEPRRFEASPRRRFVKAALVAALVVAIVGAGTWIVASRVGRSTKTALPPTRVPARAWQLTA